MLELSLHQSAIPLICIYAAPTSLCIAGYVQSVMPKSYGFLMGMFVVATVIYIFALVKAIGYLKMPFFPSYAAFTFPFVISVPEICGIDRDDYCGCSGCVYLYPIYGIYLWWKEINKIIKNNKEWLLVVGQPLFVFLHSLEKKVILYDMFFCLT